MLLGKLFSGAVSGVDAIIITIEVTIIKGTKYFIVGLPDNAIQESRHRVESAIRNNTYFFPRKKTVVNMAPAGTRKEGSAYDLPIALGVLLASGQIDPVVPTAECLIMGELSLDGDLLPVKGALPISIEARKKGFKRFILPAANAEEAAIVEGISVLGVNHLLDVVGILTGKSSVKPAPVTLQSAFVSNEPMPELDFQEVKGQENIKRALEIAAAGGHNVILIGPPGAGKTMLAKRLPTILPPLSLQESLETTKIHSVAGKLRRHSSLIASRPFRSPHHTVSDVALVGGGKNPQPGEISLAHNGVLFLDELPEFKRNVLEVLRQPMEERRITISRARFSVEYPAFFMLVASMNPCPCGYYNHPEKDCSCAPGSIQRYLNRISGPLMDRIDLHVEVTPVPISELTKNNPAEKSETIRERVIRAREIQEKRFGQNGVYCNAQMPRNILASACSIDEAGMRIFTRATEKLGLSARAYDRILKVSRTIADLGESEHIRPEHLAEAIQYRSLDREGWAG